MKINYITHWQTTIIGIVIILASLGSVFFAQSTWTDASIGLGIGILLIFSPDTIFKKLSTFIKVLALFCLTSCVSEKKLAKICAEKYPIKDSIVYVASTDTLYEYVKGDSIKLEYIVNNVIKYKDTICPPKRVKTIIKSTQKIVYQENTAKTHILQVKCDDLMTNTRKLENNIADKDIKITNLQRFKNYTISLLIVLAMYTGIMLYLKK